MKAHQMKAITATFLILICVPGYSQTRRIGSRSHAASMYQHGDAADGNYGIYPTESKRYVIIHLESGRDTAVTEDDSLAHPFYADSLNKKFRMPDQKKKIHGIGQLGQVTGKLITVSP